MPAGKNTVKQIIVFATAVAVLAIGVVLSFAATDEPSEPSAQHGHWPLFATPSPAPIDAPLMPENIFDFPSLHIYSDYDPFAVERGFWHSGRLSVSGTSAPFILDDIAVDIRGRGNSTWHFGEEKRPLRLRFNTPRAILDSTHAARDWVLIANLFDFSLVRTHLAFYLAGLLDGMHWSPFSRLVHVYINGVYQGVYQLADERDEGAGRAELTYNPFPAYSEFLLEFGGDATTRDRLLSEGQIEGDDFIFANGWVIDVRFPRQRHRYNHMAYLLSYIERLDAAIKARDYHAILSKLCLDSLIDFYLVNELFKTIDISHRSIFMQIRGTGENRRLHFGPVWDFDRSSGNMAFWYTPYDIFAAQRNSWFADLLATPEIFSRTALRWNEIRNNELLQMIDYAQLLLDNYENALSRNFERHYHIFAYPEPDWIFMVPTHLRTIDTIQGQLHHLIEWFHARANWLDGHFN
jgi:hypothetical protein